MNHSFRGADDFSETMPPTSPRWRYKPDVRLKRAVRRVLIALSFRSDKPLRSRSTDRGVQSQTVPWQWPSNSTVPAAVKVVKETSPGLNTQYWDPSARRSSLTSLHGDSDVTSDSDVSTDEEIDEVNLPTKPPSIERRKAIFDGKGWNSTIIEETTPSPTNSSEEGDTLSISDCASERRLLNRRKMSSAELGFSYPGDLLSQARPRRTGSRRPLVKRNTDIAFAKGRCRQTPPLATLLSTVEPDRKSKNAFSLLKLIDKKSHRTKALMDVLQRLRRSQFKDSYLSGFKDAHWREVVEEANCTTLADRPITNNERRRRDAAWELFTSECVFLLDHLMTLKHCFMEPLKEVQVEGQLMFAEPHDLFGNLDEVSSVIKMLKKVDPALLFYWACTSVENSMVVGCRRSNCRRGSILVIVFSSSTLMKYTVNGSMYHAELVIEIFEIEPSLVHYSGTPLQVSHTFCHEFIALLLKDAKEGQFGRTEVLLRGLKRFCELTRDGEVYHDYCLNYTKAMTYLEQLRKNDEFCVFEKWCEQDARCRRLQLNDLLISPMQHCTKVPLLLNNIRRYTDNPDERNLLTEALAKLENSLKTLDSKMNWLKNYERIQEIQQQLVWKSIAELEPRAFVPGFMRPALSRQPCDRLLASPRRQLIHEGPLTLIEVSKNLEMFMFLFDDILLLTKVKKLTKKKPLCHGDSTDSCQSQSTPKFCSAPPDGVVYVVYRQPIALDRYTVHDVIPPDLIDNTSSEVGSLARCSFVLVQITRFQQIIGVYTLQAPSESVKATWMRFLIEAQETFRETIQQADRNILQGRAPGSDCCCCCPAVATKCSRQQSDQAAHQQQQQQQQQQQHGVGLHGHQAHVTEHICCSCCTAKKQQNMSEGDAKLSDCRNNDLDNARSSGSFTGQNNSNNG